MSAKPAGKKTVLENEPASPTLPEQSDEQARGTAKEGSDKTDPPPPTKPPGPVSDSSSASGGPQGDDEPVHVKVAELAVHLVAAQVSASAKAALPFDAAHYDELFAGAMVRARRLLSPSRQTLRDHVFAEQLFEEGEIMNTNQIKSRFIKAGWPGMQGQGKMGETMETISAWYVSHVEELRGRLWATINDHYKAYGDFLDSMFDFCKRAARNSQNGLSPEDIRELADGIREHVFSDLIKGRLTWIALPEKAKIFEWECHSELILKCFDGRHPADCLKRSPAPKSLPRKKVENTRGSSGGGRYNPRLLFSYLRYFGDRDELGRKLNSELKIPGLDLKGKGLNLQSMVDDGRFHSHVFAPGRGRDFTSNRSNVQLPPRLL